MLASPGPNPDDSEFDHCNWRKSEPSDSRAGQEQRKEAAGFRGFPSYVQQTYSSVYTISVPVFCSIYLYGASGNISG
jgi:hypothetical protein